MDTLLAQVLAGHRDEIASNAMARLTGRVEFVGDPDLLAASVRTLADALLAAADAAQPEVLAERALALGRDDIDPCRGYGRVQLLLDALCCESVETVRRAVPGAEGRERTAALRALWGPAMLGLAQLCHGGSGAGSPSEG